MTLKQLIVWTLGMALWTVLNIEPFEPVTRFDLVTLIAVGAVLYVLIVIAGRKPVK